MAPVQLHAQLAGPNETGVAFGHVHLNVTDVGLHAELWSEVFGGVAVTRGGFTAVRLPGTLVFLTEGVPSAPSAATSMDHVALAVRDLDRVLASWRAAGYDVALDPSDGRRLAIVILPDGATLELVENIDLEAPAAMHHVHFVSERTEDLLRFHADLFGADSGSAAAGSGVATVPGSGLRFDRAERARSPTEGTAIDHVGFEVTDVRAFASRAEDRGIEFVFGPALIESLGIWVGFFVDPSGVLIEVTQGLGSF